MINVFIDTSVFVAEGFVKGKCIATLFDAAQAEMIHILMPDITEHEIRCHLHEEVEKKRNGGTGTCFR
jgi:predicted nucleic acid-binding protein